MHGLLFVAHTCACIVAYFSSSTTAHVDDSSGYVTPLKFNDVHALSCAMGTYQVINRVL